MPVNGGSVSPSTSLSRRLVPAGLRALRTRKNRWLLGRGMHHHDGDQRPPDASRRTCRATHRTPVHWPGGRRPQECPHPGCSGVPVRRVARPLVPWITSFEDLGTAEVLNADSVSIKVDREERPDVDAHYDRDDRSDRVRRLAQASVLDRRRALSRGNRPPQTEIRNAVFSSRY